MNRSALKKYAPQARLDFIEAVTLRARRLGLDPALPVSVEQTGDVLLIAGQPFPASVAKQRTALAQRIQRQGFSAVVEALAYTWFNRLVAIRFMELKGYLSHGYRVLSHPQGQQPEILDHVQHLDLPSLDKVEVIRLKTAGNQDEALFREILLAQCHELHRYMPFLFEALDDATELLLPDNLLRTDSPIAHLVSDIEEVDWQEVEVIGWMYQFYISDRKDEVIGKVVKSEDIPAATQLFTPNWIVQYLVQNSLGRLWLMANPGSSLKDKMPYYIEPAEQTPEVQAQLDALVRVRMDEDGGTLNPESLTVLDPACGSGHILVEAYNLLRAIYEERGYRLRDIPRLILQKNLFGLDIDDRAAQLAGFALLMKAREDDRRLFDDNNSPPHLNVMAIHQSAGLPDENMAQAILDSGIQIESGETLSSGQLFGSGQLEAYHSSGITIIDLRQLIQLFEHGKTFGSLIIVPDPLKEKLGKIFDLLATVRSRGDNLARSYATQVLEQFAWPASLLAMEYDAVVANPPYMGSKYYNPIFLKYLNSNYKAAKGDLYTCFMSRNAVFAKHGGEVAMITIPNWMFLSSFSELREWLFGQAVIETLVHNGRGVFGSDFGSCAFTLRKFELQDYKGIYRKLFDKQGRVSSNEDLSKRFLKHEKFYAAVGDFREIPGSPVAYWVAEGVLKAFRSPKLATLTHGEGKNVTADNARFLRLWWEVEHCKIGRDEKWIPYAKGGDYRKWAGNLEYVCNWSVEARTFYRNNHASRIVDEKYWYLPGVTWTVIATSGTAFRYLPEGCTFDTKGLALFFDSHDDIMTSLGLLNSVVGRALLQAVNPTMCVNTIDVKAIPFSESLGTRSSAVEEMVRISTDDWNYSETSLAFSEPPMLIEKAGFGLLSELWEAWSERANKAISVMTDLELNNDHFFIDAYGLAGELTPQVSEDQITLTRASHDKDGKAFISYALGCLMGRFSLDEPGVVYAGSGNVGFNVSRYRKFAADSDGIIPVTEEPYYDDDATERVRQFVKVGWGADNQVENMEWLADSLGRKAGECADEAVRRYLSTSFYKDHLQTYRKRPIYWLFSSGKQKAFECLVYLHRYNEGTLSRMRMEYVVPLQSRMQARIDKLTDDIDSATSSAQQKALQKRKDKLTKQLEELRRFDENLRPYADQRISLDLDDGVKVNYGKFGSLLAEVKAITGSKED